MLQDFNFDPALFPAADIDPPSQRFGLARARDWTDHFPTQRCHIRRASRTVRMCRATSSRMHLHCTVTWYVVSHRIELRQED